MITNSNQNNQFCQIACNKIGYQNLYSFLNIATEFTIDL